MAFRSTFSIGLFVVLPLLCAGPGGRAGLEAEGVAAVRNACRPFGRNGAEVSRLQLLRRFTKSLPPRFVRKFSRVSGWSFGQDGETDILIIAGEQENKAAIEAYDFTRFWRYHEEIRTFSWRDESSRLRLSVTPSVPIQVMTVGGYIRTLLVRFENQLERTGQLGVFDYRRSRRVLAPFYLDLTQIPPTDRSPFAQISRILLIQEAGTTEAIVLGTYDGRVVALSPMKTQIWNPPGAFGAVLRLDSFKTQDGRRALLVHKRRGEILTIELGSDEIRSRITLPPEVWDSGIEDVRVMGGGSRRVLLDAGERCFLIDPFGQEEQRLSLRDARSITVVTDETLHGDELFLRIEGRLYPFFINRKN